MASSILKLIEDEEKKRGINRVSRVTSEDNTKQVSGLVERLKKMEPKQSTTISSETNFDGIDFSQGTKTATKDRKDMTFMERLRTVDFSDTGKMLRSSVRGVMSTVQSGLAATIQSVTSPKLTLEQKIDSWEFFSPERKAQEKERIKNDPEYANELNKTLPGKPLSITSLAPTLLPLRDRLLKGAEENRKKADVAIVGVPIVDNGSFWANVSDPQWIHQMITLQSGQYISSVGLPLAAALIMRNPRLAVSAPTANKISMGIAGTNSFLMNTGDVYERAIEKGESVDVATNKAVAVGITNAYLDTLPVSRALNKLPGGNLAQARIKNRVGSYVLGVSKEFLAEGVTESIQEVVANAVLADYEEDKPLWDNIINNMDEYFAGVPESFVIGGLMGAGMDVVMSGTQSLTNRNQNKLATDLDKEMKELLSKPSTQLSPTERQLVSQYTELLNKRQEVSDLTTGKTKEPNSVEQSLVDDKQIAYPDIYERPEFAEAKNYTDSVSYASGVFNALPGNKVGYIDAELITAPDTDTVSRDNVEAIVDKLTNTPGDSDTLEIIDNPKFGEEGEARFITEKGATTIEAGKQSGRPVPVVYKGTQDTTDVAGLTTIEEYYERATGNSSIDSMIDQTAQDDTPLEEIFGTEETREVGAGGEVEDTFERVRALAGDDAKLSDAIAAVYSYQRNVDRGIFTPEVVKTLKKIQPGITSLSPNGDGTITLWHWGEIDPDVPISYSQNKVSDQQVEYRVPSKDVIANFGDPVWDELLTWWMSSLQSHQDTQGKAGIAQYAQDANNFWRNYEGDEVTAIHDNLEFMQQESKMETDEQQTDKAIQRQTGDDTQPVPDTVQRSDTEQGVDRATDTERGRSVARRGREVSSDSTGERPRPQPVEKKVKTDQAASSLERATVAALLESETLSQSDLDRIVSLPENEAMSLVVELLGEKGEITQGNIQLTWSGAGQQWGVTIFENSNPTGSMTATGLVRSMQRVHNALSQEVPATDTAIKEQPVIAEDSIVQPVDLDTEEPAPKPKRITKEQADELFGGKGEMDISKMTPEQINERITQIAEARTKIKPSQTGERQEVTLTSKPTEEELAFIKNYQTAGGRSKEGLGGRGLLDEYYTPIEVVDKTLEIVAELVPNYKTAATLEPSAGTGNFLRDSAGARVTAFEINDTPSRVLKMLNPNAQVFNDPFESLFIAQNGEVRQNGNRYELLLGNPPYGEHRGMYKGLGEEPRISKYEEYFMKRGMETLKEDGVMAVVVPSSFLNSSTSGYAKQEIAKLGYLVRAIRLPEGIFGTTTIGTDIVVMRRSSLSDTTGREIESRLANLSGGLYFQNHPDHIAGEVVKEKNRFGKEVDVVKGSVEDLANIETPISAEEVTETSTDIPTEIQEDVDDTFPTTPTEFVGQTVGEYLDRVKALKNKYKDPAHRKFIDNFETGFREMINEMSRDLAMDGEVFIDLPTLEQDILDRIYQDEYRITNEGKSIEDVIVDYLQKKKTEQELNRINEEAESQGVVSTKGRSPKDPEVERKVQKNVTMVSDKKDQTVKLDAGVSKTELEMWKNVEATGEMSKSFETKIGFDSTPAGVKGFNQKGYNVIKNDKGVYQIQPDFNYYQGKIYEKLDALESIKSQISNDSYRRQKAGLMEILPTPKTVQEINLTPVSDFVRDINVTSSRGETVPLLSGFQEYLRSLPRQAFMGSDMWEITGYVQGRIVNTGDKVRNITVRKRRREVGNRLFKKYIQEELAADVVKEVERKFNRNYNGYVRPDYTKVPITAPINKTFYGEPLSVRPIQREGAAFLTYKGNGLLGYDVGVGKTMTAIIGVNEVLSKGWAKKPLLVVPNSVYLKWLGEIKEIIPKVKINMLGNLGSKFNGDLKTLKVPDGSLSVITYEGLTKLGFSQETYQSLTADLRDTMTGLPSQATDRAREKEKARVSETVGKAMKQISGEVSFEDLGFDHVTIDEVHNFKNIFASARLEKGQVNEYRNIQGSTSMRGIKAYLMTQYILSQNNGRNVFLLSATPFTNSPLEIYSILSLMGKKRLEEAGVKNVNDFMNMFMELTPKQVIKADQSVKEEDVVEKFQNLGELQQLVTEFIDFRTGEEAGVIRPTKEKKQITLKPTAKQSEYFDKAQELFTTKDGSILAGISEMQHITLSPFLSRYSKEPPKNSTQFIEESPKLKATMDMIAQVKRDSERLKMKDEDGKPLGAVGQVIYMPRGIEYFHLVQDYLIKKLGYGANEIGVIKGGMSVDAKDKIKTAFNEGRIKILIGTETIKEGVDLQKRSTELYHLHLPWNPTDMVQVEGRIWRQGNFFNNVRINYPLIENSVDSFTFQKLETKERRIKNLWSYKGNEIDVGDLDFEEMKLDLITDPVRRVETETQMEVAKVDQAMREAEAERAFLIRAIEKFETAKQTITSSERTINEYKADTSDYAKSVVDSAKKKKRDAATIVSGLLPKIEANKARSIELTDQIDKQTKQKDKLMEDRQTKLEKAKNQRHEVIIKPNDYKALTSQLSTENKTFWNKPKPLKGTKSNANVGVLPGQLVYEVAETLTGQAPQTLTDVDTLQPINFPELVRLTKELGSFVTINGNLPEQVLGRFRKLKGIELNAGLFKNPISAAKTLAHEIGHLTDWLPDEMLTRGNLLGRLYSLHKHMRNTYGETDVTNSKLKEELWELSQYWKPIPPGVEESYIKYRRSSRELYADAISVLLNSPGTVERIAPTFYEHFFSSLDAKTEVRDAYWRMQEDLNASDEVLQKRRLDSIYEGYKKGAEKRAEIERETVNRTDRKGRSKTQEWKDKFVQSYVSRWDPIMSTFEKDLNLTGTTLTEYEKTRNALELFEQRHARVKLYLDETMNNIIQPLLDVGLTESDFGVILELDRAIGERFDIANPGGLIGEFPAQVRDYYKGTLTEEQIRVIEQVKERFHEVTFQAVEAAAKSGLISKKTFEEKIKPNKHFYATFQVIKYIDDNYVSSAIKKQVGTVSQIENPLISTVLKTISTIEATSRNNAVKTVVKANLANDAEGIQEATAVKGKDGFVKYFKRDKELDGQLEFRQDGKPVAYNVDGVIEKMFEVYTGEEMGALLDVTKSFNRVFKPVVTTYNLSWGLWSNIVRDVKSTGKMLNSMSSGGFFNAFKTVGEVLSSMVNNLGSAHKFAKGELDDLTREILSVGGMNAPWDGVDPHATGDLDIDPVLRKYRYLKDTKNSKVNGTLGRVPGFEFVSKILDGFKIAGGTFEAAGKIGGYQTLKKRGVSAKKAGFLTRNYIGTPNWATGGTAKQITNDVFVFSNVMTQALRREAEVMTAPKTRYGYWMATMAYDVVPKMVMLAVAAGLLGEKLKDEMDKATEYDKTNYIVIPLGTSEGRAVYARIPHDEGGRFWSALTWKMGQYIRGEGQKPEQLLDVAVNTFIPGTTPLFSIAGGWLNYIQGRNPYDSYRGRLVIDDTTWQAGGLPVLKKMVQYTLNEAGIANFATYDDAREQWWEAGMKHIPVLNRIIRVSDYGLIEKANSAALPIEREEARQRLADRAVLDRYAALGRKADTSEQRVDLAKSMVKEVLGDAPYDQKDREKAKRLINSYRMELLPERNNPRVAPLLRADTNNQKVGILLQFNGEMERGDFKKLLQYLYSNKIISEDVIKQLAIKVKENE